MVMPRKFKKNIVLKSLTEERYENFKALKAIKILGKYERLTDDTTLNYMLDLLDEKQFIKNLEGGTNGNRKPTEQPTEPKPV